MHYQLSIDKVRIPSRWWVLQLVHIRSEKYLCNQGVLPVATWSMDIVLESTRTWWLVELLAPLYNGVLVTGTYKYRSFLFFKLRTNAHNNIFINVLLYVTIFFILLHPPYIWHLLSAPLNGLTLLPLVSAWNKKRKMKCLTRKTFCLLSSSVCICFTLLGLFVWTYQLESTVFFSYNKTASAGLSASFNTSRTSSCTLCFILIYLQLEPFAPPDSLKKHERRLAPWNEQH